MFVRRLNFAIVLLALIATTASCSRGQATVKQPSINPSESGRLAMEMYDKNGDGKVAGDELEAAPGLKAALPRFDTNSDGGVSADEVTARVNVWKSMQTGLAAAPCHVTLDGQPLSGATVVYEPEGFLGDQIKTATGLTSAYGDAHPTIAPKDRPAPNLPGGVHLGLYKVRISKIVNGKETIPARYNTETILGQEVAHDDPAIQNHKVVFALKSK